MKTFVCSNDGEIRDSRCLIGISDGCKCDVNARAVTKGRALIEKKTNAWVHIICGKTFGWGTSDIPLVLASTATLDGFKKMIYKEYPKEEIDAFFEQVEIVDVLIKVV